MINLNSLTKNIKDGFKAPTGDSNRETPTKGALRFNTQTGKPEIYAKGRGWRRASVSEISAIYTHDNLVAFYDASNADTTGDTSDQYYSDVSLLLHMNGTDGSTTFVDSSNTANTISTNGTVNTSVDEFKFGGSSAYFSGGRLDFSNISVANLQNQTAYTIEGWFYQTSSSSKTVYFYNKDTQAGVSIASWQLGLKTDNTIEFAIRGGATLVSTNTTSLNTWNHFAVTRSSGTVRLFLNGNLESSTTSNINITDQNNCFNIGQIPGFDSGHNFSGYLDEFRLTKGVARYTSNFTPQTREFYPGDSVSDLTSNDIDSVYVGNVTLNSTEPKSFDWPSYTSGGGVNYLQSVSNLSTLPVLNDNLTIIAWARYDDGAFSSDKYHQIFNLYVDSDNYIQINKSRNGYSPAPNKLNCLLKSGGNATNIKKESSLSSSTGWFQVAVTLSNNELKLYFNTDLAASDSVSSSRSTSQTSFSIGKYFDSTNSVDSDMYGSIALFKVYDSALSNADITNEFNYHKSTFGL